MIAVAVAGAVLEDGTKIRRAKLRGVPSGGLVIEPVQDPVGTDLTERYGAPVLADDGPGAPVKWTKIQLLHAVRGELVAAAEYAERPAPTLRYRAKVKLHGTNAGIQIHPDGRVIAQGRNRALTIADDQYGFAAWVAERRDVFTSLAQPDGLIVLFGEWAGPGIQKKVATTKVPAKFFAVFAVQIGDPILEASRIAACPSHIAGMLPEIDGLHVLPWFGPTFELDFGDAEQMQGEVDRINAQVDAVEQCDPWVEATFGVRGVGEGLVLYPLPDGAEGDFEPQPRDEVTDAMFKAKGEKHQVMKSDRPVMIDPTVLASIDAFVDAFVTEARLEQAVGEVFGTEAPSLKQMGPFLKWIGQDILAEGQAELEASGLAWKQVSRAVTLHARSWLLGRVRS